MKAKVISRKGKALLLEWRSDLDIIGRGTVQAEDYKGIETGAVIEFDPETDSFIPYGLPWEDLLPKTVPVQNIANQLRKDGIWTIEDFKANQDRYGIVIRAAIGLETADMRNKIRELEE